MADLLAYHEITRNNPANRSNLNRRLLPLDKVKIEPKPMFRSPFSGTDILSKPTKLLSCPEQTQCIVPELQLQHEFKVYYCKRVSFGVRFYYLIREGLTLHPKVKIVDDADAADLLIYLPESAAWHKSECSNPRNVDKVNIYLSRFAF